MNKKTKNIRQALERLAHVMDVKLTKVGAKFSSPAWAGSKNAKKALAFLADRERRTRTSETVRMEDVRWYGIVPTSGLSAWEQEALEWLHLERDTRREELRTRVRASVKGAKTRKRMVRARAERAVAHA